MAEATRAISHNTGVVAVNDGMEMTKSLREVTKELHEGLVSKEPEKTADEVIEHMRNRLGKLGKGKE